MTRTKTINLALQGGGAHGAYGWGVLDALLSDGRIAIEGISATSAGAMNAVVLAQGWLNGGAAGARAALDAFWRDVSVAGSSFSAARAWPWSDWFRSSTPPLQLWMDVVMRMFSPYQWNPLNINPLRDLLLRHVDFEALQSRSPFKLFLCATNVESGKIRLFGNHELSPDAVLASACLPLLFQAVQIDGEYFWDGGYMGNPAIYPLIYDCTSRDVVIVHINPIVRRGCPTGAAEILDRVNELSFNSTLMREMRAIAFVGSLLDQGKVHNGELKRMFIHSVRSDTAMTDLGVASKFNTDWQFLSSLCEAGRAQGRDWLAQNFKALGRQSSVDIRAEFL
ncbi:MAG: patatin-like phospholipase family protein [Rhodocyclaceae bacterium]|nr:patatin-like phospholipase family protein [Rhodocyclaceae bacterium]MBX3670665.1 patatin-like phospholipase family protein [Rhodocyclaceae bacterium]